MITIYYCDKYGTFNFIPFVENVEKAKRIYLNLVWRGCRSVQIQSSDYCNPEKNSTIWETKNKVFPQWETNPELGF